MLEEKTDPIKKRRQAHTLFTIEWARPQSRVSPPPRRLCSRSFAFFFLSLSLIE